MKFNCAFGPALLSLCFLIIVGCEKEEAIESTATSIFKISDSVSFDDRKNSFIVNGNEFNNVVQSSLSNNKINSIVTVVENRKIAVVVTKNDSDEIVEYKTVDSSVLFDPVVNDNGNFAFVKQMDKITESQILLNNNILDLPVGLYKGLVMNNDFIIAHYSEKTGKDNKLLVYNLSNSESFFYSLSITPDSFRFLSGDEIYIEGLSTISNNRKQSIFNIYDDEIQYSDVEESSRDIDVILSNSALLKLTVNDPGLSLACIDNSLGRLSWFVSYRLDALSYFASKKDLSPKLPYDSFIENAVDCLLDQYEFDSELSIIGWSTTKYSLSKDSRLSLMVNNAQIAYVLLKLARKNQLNKAQKAKVISISERLYDFYERDFDYSNSLYKFQYGIDYWADGVWMPWNMQNTFGLALLELYDVTGKAIYFKRAELLMQSFINETSIHGNRLLWHYWPSRFYGGWSEEDNLSVNTQSREPMFDTLYEDTIHASTNVLFISEYYRRSDVKFDYYIQLNNTLEKMFENGTYSRFISADNTIKNSHLMYLPYHGGGWASLRNSALKKSVASGIPNVDVFFEGDKVFSYVTFLSDYE